MGKGDEFQKGNAALYLYQFDFDIAIILLFPITHSSSSALDPAVHALVTLTIYIL